MLLDLIHHYSLFIHYMNLWPLIHYYGPDFLYHSDFRTVQIIQIHIDGQFQRLTKRHFPEFHLLLLSMNFQFHIDSHVIVFVSKQLTAGFFGQRFWVQ